MSDLSALEPWLIGYFVIAAVAVVLAVAAITSALSEARQSRRTRPVLSIATGHPAVAAANRHAA
jgi:hypothetical protein